MIGNSGLWRPGMKSHESDGRLLDVRTGRYRRIAFHGTSTTPGCFTRDRTRVVVTGVDIMSAVIGLYEIDLKTGANRQLGGDLLATGFSLFPSLSPDGKTVALLHQGASARLLGARICLVDLATGNAKPLGEPRDTGPPCWFPDGKALVIIDRKSIDVSSPAISTICRLDLDGRLTKLCPGASPVVLGDGKRILFEDQTTRTWKTCALDGGDVKIYADGMKGCGFPAPSPDGKRLLMMHFVSGRAPEPLIFPLDQSEGKPATTAPGLWAIPCWR
jgi:Tol biopolymer transport system component